MGHAGRPGSVLATKARLSPGNEHMCAVIYRHYADAHARLSMTLRCASSHVGELRAVPR